MTSGNPGGNKILAQSHPGNGLLLRLRRKEVADSPIPVLEFPSQWLQGTCGLGGDPAHEVYRLTRRVRHKSLAELFSENATLICSQKTPVHVH
jgi:hypothetical protein